MLTFSSRNFFLALSLAAATLVVSVGGVSFFRKVQTFQPSGFRVEVRDNRWFIDSADLDLTFEVGDQLMLVNGGEISTRQDLIARLAETPTSQVMVVRGEEVLELTYRRPSLDLDLAYLIQAVIGVIYLLIGLYTLMRDLNGQVVLFYLWCLASAVVYLFTGQPAYEFAINLQPDLTGLLIYTLEEVAILLLPPLTLHFFLIFPSPLSERGWYKTLVPFLYLPAAVLLTLQVDLIFTSGKWLAGNPTKALPRLDRLEPYLLVVFSFIAVGVLFYRQFRAKPWQQRRQVLWVMCGMAGGYLPFLLLYLVPTSLGLEWPEILTVLSVLPLALVPLSLAYALLRYRLWDVAIIVRDVITYTITLLLGVLAFALLHLLIQRGLPEAHAVTRSVMNLGSGLLIVGLLVPTKQGISATLERVQYRSHLSKRRGLLEFGRELLRERDLEGLCFGLLNRLEDAMDLERSNLYLTAPQGMVPVWMEEGLPAELTTDSLGQDVWQQDLTTLSGSGLAGLDLSPVETLFFLGYRYAFPLTVRGNPVGVVLTGEKRGQRPFNSDDVMLIRQLLNQAALAIDNAQLLEQLQRQLSEVLELKQFNEEIIESSPAGIAVLDETDVVVSANLAFAALAGVERSATRRRRLTELLPLESLPVAGEGLIEVSHSDPRGRERHLQLSAATFQGSPSQKLKVLVVNDVSERVAMERAMKEQERLAALGVMAAGVAHEINTPLTGVSSYAQMLLAETPETDPRYELLKKIEKQTFRAARIVNNLLDFARNRDGEPRPVHLGNLLEESADFLTRRMSEQRIKLDWTFPEERILVSGDEGELNQLFTNLLVNALDAMSDSGGTLTLGLDADETKAFVAVEDTGPGIPPNQLRQIFEPFYTTKLGTGGTGLGLAISREIVRRHGGQMRVANNATATGCRFVVELPRYHPQTREPS